MAHRMVCGTETIALSLFTCKSMSEIFNRFRLNKSFMMLRSMRGASKKNKILNTIIVNFAINMVNYFIRCYRSLQMFGHYKNTFVAFDHLCI